MTIEELLGKTSEELQALSDTQLEEYFKDVLHITRPPEKLQKEQKETPQLKKKAGEYHKDMAKDMLKNFLKDHPEFGKAEDLGI